MLTPVLRKVGFVGTRGLPVFPYPWLRYMNTAWSMIGPSELPHLRAAVGDSGPTFPFGGEHSQE